ncbi:MAG: helix-turn-helix transcriptional regulator [Anaerolineae bacterium]|nr:helix-turn-helix transcriptional regulator [Anaerolineae bacterium]
MARAVVRSRLREFVEAKSKEYGFRITQSQLGNAVGLPQPTIATWMSNQPMEQINVRVLASLASYFGVEPFELLTLEYIEDDISPETKTHHVALPISA